MTQQRPEAEFGPHMEYREHSFLRNPRMPAAVRRSRVHVSICLPVKHNDAPGKCHMLHNTASCV